MKQKEGKQMTKKLLFVGIACLVVGALIGTIVLNRQPVQAAYGRNGEGRHQWRNQQTQMNGGAAMNGNASTNNNGSCPVANGGTCDPANCPTANGDACPGRVSGGCPGAANGACPNQVNGTCPGMAAGRGHHGR